MLFDNLPFASQPRVADGEPRRPSTEEILQWVAERTPRVAAPAPSSEGFSPEDDQEFRPSLRPPVPVLTLLDDGSHDRGEEIRLRTEVFAIGRTSGDLRLPHDPAVSSAHAEIRRMPWRGGYQWILHDVGSLNGTFARCTRAILHDTAVVILGSRRFRVSNPLRPPVSVAAPAGQTNVLDNRHIPAVVYPVLEELSGKPDPLRLPLRSDKMTLGRTGGGADVELDDPLLAYQHATLTRQRDGSWLIVGDHTRNGVWVSTLAVAFTSQCHFRLGEQIFRFVIP
jgi:pSer/pThr/pTyr-binding forkhead associated (FHA) protein